MIGNNKNIHLLTASDRINYGDLLFPLITKEILNRAGLNLQNYGLIKSDLSNFGAIPTKSYKKLQKVIKNENDSILIIGGGEVFFPSWTLLYSYINRNFSHLLNYKSFSRFENKYQFSKKLLSNGRVDLPFVPGIKDFNSTGTKIIFNAVGGALDLIDGTLKKRTIKNLKTASYLSVRDKVTHQSLCDEEITAKLTPDSAIIISDLYTKQKLYNSNRQLKEILDSTYLFFQLGEQYSPQDKNRLKEELEILGRNLGLKIILCPIGLASGHNDHKILKEIANLSSCFEYIQPKNLFEIMCLIAHSNLYLGTSLHGAITAQSYEIPFLPLYKIPKLMRFYNTWHDHLPSFDFNINNLLDIFPYIKEWNFKIINKNNEIQKKLVYENYEAIINKILN